MVRHRMMMAVLPLMLSAGPAFAHAFLEHARPPVGSELASPPPAVSITFTEDVEPQFSRIEVRTTTGTRVDKGDLHADGDRARLAVSLPHLAPGTYTVSWHVTSIDTHKTEGQFTFTVKP